jgi:hypothetical protein
MSSLDRLRRIRQCILRIQNEIKTSPMQRPELEADLKALREEEQRAMLSPILTERDKQ